MQQMKIHKKRVHKGDKFKNCLICDAKFATNQGLNMHVTTVHDKMKLFNCPICETIFSHKSTMVKHIAVVHDGQNPTKSKSGNINNEQKEKHLVCSICMKSYPEKTSLAVHEEAEHSMVVVLCDVMAK